jgi:tight adherence protein B
VDIVWIGALIFVCTVVSIELISYGVRNMRSTQRLKIRKRLRKHVYVSSAKDDTEILKKRVFSDVDFLNDLLHRIPGAVALDRLVIQANAKYPMGFYLLLALLLAAVGLAIGNTVLRNPAYAAVLAVFGALIPFGHLARLKRLRVEKFKRQLPDGLDLIARALKAGHAFTGGMSLAAEEFDDPLGPEFSETLDEINFGVSVQEALKNLMRRVDCEEIKYFVVGVILQRETGGNLAELMTTLATLIRERFKFEGKVQTLTAEGRFSAVVLVALPFALFGYLWVTTPNFLKPLLTEPAGKLMILLAIVFMALGALVIKRMVKVKV